MHHQYRDNTVLKGGTQNNQQRQWITGLRVRRRDSIYDNTGRFNIEANLETFSWSNCSSLRHSLSHNLLCLCSALDVAVRTSRSVVRGWGLGMVGNCNYWHVIFCRSPSFFHLAIANIQTWLRHLKPYSRPPHFQPISRIYMTWIQLWEFQAMRKWKRYTLWLGRRLMFPKVSLSRWPFSWRSPMFSVPGMYDSQLAMGLSQHLFDVQMGKWVGSSTQDYWLAQ